jgi:PAP2 superfamily protein
MSSPPAYRSLAVPSAALLLALAACYGLWLAGPAPVAPHQVLLALIEFDDPYPLSRIEGFAGLWQGVVLVLLISPWWPWRLRLGLAAAGIALATAYQVAIGRPYWWLHLYAFLSGAGLVMLVFLVHQWFFAVDPSRKTVAGFLVRGVLLFVAFGVVTKTYLIFSSAQAVPVLDWSALKLDAAAFGFSPSEWAARSAPEHGGIRRVLAIAYELLPIAMTAVFGLEARNPDRLSFGVLNGLFVCGFAAALAYSITPVAGPVYAFGATYPGHLGQLLGGTPGWLATQPGFAPRNAFPSFHFAWALLALHLASAQASGARIAFAAYAAAIAWATLALGEHYLVDLVASVPVLVAIVALCIERPGWRSRERIGAVLCGLAAYFVWSILLLPSVANTAARFPAALLAWCCASVAASLYVYRRLMLSWKRVGGAPTSVPT